MRRVLTAAVLLVLLPGCREKTRRMVGPVPKGANHIFWQTVHAANWVT